MNHREIKQRRLEQRGQKFKKSQVRQTDQVWYHDDMDESSLARAIHASTSPLLVESSIAVESGGESGKSAVEDPLPRV